MCWHGTGILCKTHRVVMFLHLPPLKCEVQIRHNLDFSLIFSAVQLCCRCDIICTLCHPRNCTAKPPIKIRIRQPWDKGRNKENFARSRNRIHERTISLRFLGIILRFFRLELCLYYKSVSNHFCSGGRRE